MNKPKTMNKDELFSILSFVFEVAKNAGFYIKPDEKSITILKDNEKTKKLLEQAYNQMKVFIQNQPEVGEEFIEKWNQIIAERVNVYNIEHFGETSNVGLVYPGTENLKQMLKEAGYNVVKKPEITMKDIRGWCDEIQENIKAHKDWSYLPDGIKDMVEEELGIKVKK